jgi:hypothetical protein
MPKGLRGDKARASTGRKGGSALSIDRVCPGRPVESITKRIEINTVTSPARAGAMIPIEIPRISSFITTCHGSEIGRQLASRESFAPKVPWQNP